MSKHPLTKERVREWLKRYVQERKEAPSIKEFCSYTGYTRSQLFYCIKQFNTFVIDCGFIPKNDCLYHRTKELLDIYRENIPKVYSREAQKVFVLNTGIAI